MLISEKNKTISEKNNHGFRLKNAVPGCSGLFRVVSLCRIRGPYFLGGRKCATLRFTGNNCYHWIQDDAGCRVIPKFLGESIIEKKWRNFCVFICLLWCLDWKCWQKTLLEGGEVKPAAFWQTLTFSWFPCLCISIIWEGKAWKRWKKRYVCIEITCEDSVHDAWQHLGKGWHQRGLFCGFCKRCLFLHLPEHIEQLSSKFFFCVSGVRAPFLIKEQCMVHICSSHIHLVWLFVHPGRTAT